jgi:phospholipid transport system transporter-binding protein
MSVPAPMAAGAAPASGEFELVAGADGRLVARGPLTFATARAARGTGRQSLAAASASSLEIDCAGISASDSAGLAVLIDWLAAARTEGRKLRYTKLPEGLKALSRLSELEELLERGV